MIFRGQLPQIFVQSMPWIKYRDENNSLIATSTLSDYSATWLYYKIVQGDYVWSIESSMATMLGPEVLMLGAISGMIDPPKFYKLKSKSNTVEP